MVLFADIQTIQNCLIVTEISKTSTVGCIKVCAFQIPRLLIFQLFVCQRHKMCGSKNKVVLNKKLYMIHVHYAGRK